MRGGLLAAATALALAGGCSGATARSPHPNEMGGSDNAGGAPNHGPAGSPAVVDCDCVDATVGWWRDGGLVPSRWQSRVEPCATYLYVNSELGEPCGSTLQGCGGAVGIDDLNTALSHPDVKQAFTRAPVLYGADPRPLDGQVDHIEVADQVIEIGEDCGKPECEVPEGVAELGRVLERLQLQEQERTICLE
jgi:hypothetical protein